MVIGIDGNEANVINRVGVSTYAYELLRYFNSVASGDQQFVIYLRNTPSNELPEQSKFFTYQIVKPDFMWSQLSLPINLYLGKKPDVFFSPAHYAPRFSPVPTVVTIHDLAYKLFPKEFLKGDLYKLNRWTEYSIRKASKVICVSKHTKKDLVRLYPSVETKTDVVYNGFRSQKIKNKNLEISPDSSESRIPIVNRENTNPYILFVGTIQPRKNVVSLISAFEIFSQSHPEYELKIVGKQGWLFNETMNKIESSTVANKIAYLGFVEDLALSDLYKNAYATVLPSYYEGFGLPVLEAMSHGSPVIASNNSSLPEITGSAALLCDPNDPQSIVTSLERLQDKKLRTDLIKESQKQVKLFSWEKCGAETLAVIRSAVA